MLVFIWCDFVLFFWQTPDPECLFSFHAGVIQGLDVSQKSHLMATTSLDRGSTVVYRNCSYIVPYTHHYMHSLASFQVRLEFLISWPKKNWHAAVLIRAEQLWPGLHLR